MPYHGAITGDHSDSHEQVKDILRGRYGPDLGVCDFNLHYRAGSGYGVITATRTPPAGGAYRPGDPLEVPRPGDIKTAVRQVLRDRNIQVWE